MKLELSDHAVKAANRLRRLASLLPLLVLAGCASVNGPASPQDPWEGFNRGVYAFNSDFDRSIGKPVAEEYTRVVPQPVRTGVTNFFSNLDDVIVLFNDLLQLKGDQSASDFSRLVWNSTVGIFGLIDVATPMQLRKHNEDFGQTLGHWGVGPGPYLVLPFLGPSDLRDGSGWVVDSYEFDPTGAIDPYYPTRVEVLLLGAIDTRARLLRASNILEQAALDPYIFMREAYLQRRQNLVYDGNPPPPPLEDFDQLPPDELPPDEPPPQ